MSYDVYCWWMDGDISDEHRIKVADQDAYDFMYLLGIVGRKTKYDKTFGLLFRTRNQNPFTKKECEEIVDIVDAQRFAEALTS